MQARAGSVGAPASWVSFSIDQIGRGALCRNAHAGGGAEGCDGLRAPAAEERYWAELADDAGEVAYGGRDGVAVFKGGFKIGGDGLPAVEISEGIPTGCLCGVSTVLSLSTYERN